MKLHPVGTGLFPGARQTWRS